MAARPGDPTGDEAAHQQDERERRQGPGARRPRSGLAGRSGWGSGDLRSGGRRRRCHHRRCSRRRFEPPHNRAGADVGVTPDDVCGMPGGGGGAAIVLPSRSVGTRLTSAARRPRRTASYRLGQAPERHQQCHRWRSRVDLPAQLRSRYCRHGVMGAVVRRPAVPGLVGTGRPALVTRQASMAGTVAGAPARSRISVPPSPS